MIDIKVNDEILKSRIIDAVCRQYNRPDRIKDVDGNEIENPVSKGEFTQNIVKSFLKEVVAGYEANKAGEVARTTAIHKANSEVIL